MLDLSCDFLLSWNLINITLWAIWMASELIIDKRIDAPNVSEAMNMIVEYVRFFTICSNGHLKIALVCGCCVIAAVVLTEEIRHKSKESKGV